MTCACDLRELLRVPLRSQGYCAGWRGLSRLLCIWWNVRGTHLELKQEPQCSSPFLTQIARSLHVGTGESGLVFSGDGTPLASRVVLEVTGHLSSCVCNLPVFPDDARGCQCPFVLCLHSQVCLRRGVRGIGFLSRADRKIGVVRHVAPHTWLVSNFLLKPASS